MLKKLHALSSSLFFFIVLSLCTSHIPAGMLFKSSEKKFPLVSAEPETNRQATKELQVCGDQIREQQLPISSHLETESEQTQQVSERTVVFCLLSGKQKYVEHKYRLSL